MASYPLNTLNCLTSVKNTGSGACVLDFKNIVSMIVAPRGVLNFTPTQIAAFQTSLNTAILAAPGARIYPLPNFVGSNDGSEKPVEQSYPYGSKSIVRDGFNIWTFNFVQGGLCVSKALRSFNNIAVDALFIDAAGLVMGRKVGANLQGIPLEFLYTAPWTLNTGAAAAGYSVQAVFHPKYVNEQVGFVACDLNTFDPSTLSGLQDIIITPVSTSTTTIQKVTVTTGCANTDLTAIFSTPLALAANWVAKDVAGATVVVSSVTITNGVATVTLATASPGGTLSLVSASALATAGISGFESIPSTIVAVA